MTVTFRFEYGFEFGFGNVEWKNGRKQPINNKRAILSKNNMILSQIKLGIHIQSI